MTCMDFKRMKRAGGANLPSSPVNKVVDDTEGINICSRLNNMSIEERCQGLHDLHGVADLPTETPEMIEKKVEEMNNVLSSLYANMGTDTSACRKALEMDSRYVETLKVPCLRCASYNGGDAAALLLRMFSQKLDLFGEERLVRQIRQCDLDEETLEALQKGLTQILPYADRSGRTVLLCLGRVNQQYDIQVVVSFNE
jgi:hypothetical protein